MAGVIAGALLIVFAAAVDLRMLPVLSAPWRWLGASLLTVHGAALVMVAIFTEAPATLRFHILGAVIGLTSLVLALLVIGWALWSAPGWRPWGAYTLAILLLTMILIALENVTFRPGAPVGTALLGGLAERALYVVSLSWFVSLGWRLSIGD